jgi:phenylpropionate dioxygenase-like ring-hydroxylating dioxygenase large terminal subunit
MPFLRNAWYVAAWPEELGRTLLTRRITGEHLVFFARKTARRSVCKTVARIASRR